MAANLAFVTASTGINFTTGLPQPIDPFTGLPESGNIMWDGREPTLESQATDGTLAHAQALAPPSGAQVQQIVDFETNVYSAQSFRPNAWWLFDKGALGGPVNLASQTAGESSANGTTFDEFSAWSAASLAETRQSIARGEAIFNTRTFTVSNVAGFNDLVSDNAFVATCSTCHSQMHGGTDVIPNSQRDLGVAGDSPAAFPAPDLPEFQLTCLNGAATAFNGSAVVTSDPGQAILTGKCSDIGKFTVPQLRALAARAPYFHDGSAATIGDVIKFYVKRFGIQLSAQERLDLMNFLLSL
jgi:cytochrome c peroxidase